MRAHTLAPWPPGALLLPHMPTLELVLKSLQSYNSKPFILMCLSQITLSVLQGKKGHKILSASRRTATLAQMGIVLWSDSTVFLKQDPTTAVGFFRSALFCHQPISTRAHTPEPFHSNVPGKLKMAQKKKLSSLTIAVCRGERPNSVCSISGILFWLELFSARSLQVTKS